MSITEELALLQDRFIASLGKPVELDGAVVVQMDRAPIRHARVKITTIAARDGEGFALKVPKGAIQLSDGRKVSLLHVWFDSGHPLIAEHAVESQTGELQVWNISNQTN